MIVKKIAYLFTVFVVGITLCAQTASANQTDEVRFSLTVWDQPLEQVLSDIEQMTGLTIIVEGNIESDPASGVYSNVTVSEFFSMAVTEKEIIVWVNSEQNIITISEVASSESNREEFLAGEMEYIIQAQQSVKQLSNKELRDLETDRLTGKTWSEVEQQLLPPVHESESSQLSQSDFLASESDYIAKVKGTTNYAQNNDKDKGNIDPMTGRNWEEIEAEMQLKQH